MGNIRKFINKSVDNIYQYRHATTWSKLRIIDLIKRSNPKLLFTGVFPIIELYAKGIDSLRRAGQSTRLIDQYIQDLFNKGVVSLVDHYGSENANDFLFKTFRDRMNLEHPATAMNIFYYKKDGHYNASLLVLEKDSEWYRYNKVNLINANIKW